MSVLRVASRPVRCPVVVIEKLKTPRECDYRRGVSVRQTQTSLCLQVCGRVPEAGNTLGGSRLRTGN